MKIRTGIILAGGDGNRFFPFSEKMRIRFLGIPLICHIHKALSQYVESIIVVGNKANMQGIKEDLKGKERAFIYQKTFHNGMADAILTLSKLTLNKDAIIVNASDIIDFSIIPSLVEKTRNNKAIFGFIAKKVKEYFPGGYVRFDKTKPVEIIEKPGKGNEPSDYVSLVLDYFSDFSSFLRQLSRVKKGENSYEYAKSLLLAKLVGYCLPYRGVWQTLKYPWHVLEMQHYYLSEIHKPFISNKAKIHRTALIEGSVYIEEGVKVGAYSKLVGPTYIGQDTTIGDFCLIRHSSIGDNCLIGARTEVVRSYISDFTMLHQNYVGDSILGKGVLMGAGAITANMRFDQKKILTLSQGLLITTNKEKLGAIIGNGSKIGIQTSIYPGVKIAENSIIYPGSVVSQDVI